MFSEPVASSDLGHVRLFRDNCPTSRVPLLTPNLDHQEHVFSAPFESPNPELEQRVKAVALSWSIARKRASHTTRYICPKCKRVEAAAEDVDLGLGIRG